ncbi:hypothetical protein ACFLR7_03220 [Acidobacteriota bacterium]
MDRRILVALTVGSLVLMVLSFSCSAEKSEWQKSNQLDTITAYQEFMETYPQSEFFPEAQSRVFEIEYDGYSQRDSIKAYRECLERYPDRPFRERAMARMKEIISNRSTELQKAQSASVVIDTAFPRNTNLKFLKNIKAESETVLEYAGYTIIDENSDDWQDRENLLLLKISVLGRALGANYGYLETRFVYTGAQISGRISFVVKGREIASKRFSEIREPTTLSVTFGKLSDEPSNKSSAPFVAVWWDIQFQKILYSLFQELFGKETLIDAMPDIVVKTEDRTLETYLTKVRPLSRIGELFQHDRSPVRRIAFKAAAGRLHESWALDSIIRCLKDKERSESVTDILVGMQPCPKLIVSLMDIVDDAAESNETRQQVRKALFTIMGEEPDKVMDLFHEQIEKIQTLEKQAKKDPENIACLKELGNRYNNMHEFDKAIVCYESIITLDPHNPDDWTGLGAMYFRTDQADAALKAFNKAIQHSAEHELSRYMKGRLLIEAFEDPVGGLQVWEELLKMNPAASFGGVNLKKKIELQRAK